MGGRPSCVGALGIGLDDNQLWTVSGIPGSILDMDEQDRKRDVCNGDDMFAIFLHHLYQSGEPLSAYPPPSPPNTIQDVLVFYKKYRELRQWLLFCFHKLYPSETLRSDARWRVLIVDYAILRSREFFQHLMIQPERVHIYLHTRFGLCGLEEIPGVDLNLPHPIPNSRNASTSSSPPRPSSSSILSLDVFLWFHGLFNELDWARMEHVRKKTEAMAPNSGVVKMNRMTECADPIVVRSLIAHDWLREYPLVCSVNHELRRIRIGGAVDVDHKLIEQFQIRCVSSLTWLSEYRAHCAAHLFVTTKHPQAVVHYHSRRQMTNPIKLGSSVTLRNANNDDGDDDHDENDENDEKNIAGSSSIVLPSLPLHVEKEDNDVVGQPTTLTFSGIQHQHHHDHDHGHHHVSIHSDHR